VADQYPLLHLPDVEGTEMTKQYSYDREVIKDFIQFLSDEHKCAVVCFPDEFAANSYVNYRFVNVSEILEEFIEGRKQ
jgi:hypothetical protein